MSFSEVSLSSTDDPEGSQMALRRANHADFFPKPCAGSVLKLFRRFTGSSA